ncbi:MAG: AMIN domain-containing protein, partial [Gemmatimonadales bacterium]
MMLQAFLLAFAAAAGSNPADVTELRVEPVAGYTEVVVRTSDVVSYSDFLLTNPARLIVDLKGARHALSKANFENIDRGGVVRVRTSQFRDDVVRVVVELTAPTSYTLTQQGDEIRVSFPNLTGDTFDSWASGAPKRTPQPVEAVATVAAPEPRRQQP